MNQLRKGTSFFPFRCQDDWIGLLEHAALKSMRTLEEIESEIQRLETQVRRSACHSLHKRTHRCWIFLQKEESTEKLSTLKEKSVVVQPEEKATIEKVCRSMCLSALIHLTTQKLRDHLRQWKNWKSAFSEIWSASISYHSIEEFL